MAAVPHSFRSSELLELALTHSSTGLERDNERLEFLGDAVLDLIVAEELFRSDAELDEGLLTELKAWVVSRRTLAEAARRLDLEGAARVGSGLQGRALPRRVLANLYEAVLGAVYLDGGYEAARAFTLETLAEELDHARRRAAGSEPEADAPAALPARDGRAPGLRPPRLARQRARARLPRRGGGRRTPLSPERLGPHAQGGGELGRPRGALLELGYADAGGRTKS